MKRRQQTKKKGHSVDTEVKAGKVSLIKGGFVLTLLSSLLGLITLNYRGIQSDFIALKGDAVEMVNNYGKVYTFCNYTVRGSRELTANQQNRLLALQDQLLLSLTKFNKVHMSLGHLVSPETYSQSHELACWMNHVILSDSKICTLELKSPDEADKWRVNVINQITRNQVEHQKIINTLKDFALSYISDPRNVLYPNPGCDLEKISEY